MADKAVEIFQIPDFAVDYIDLYLSKDEQEVIVRMGREHFTQERLEALLSKITTEPKDFVKKAYARGVFNKVEENGRICFCVASFYKRLAFFSQYEAETFQSVPENTRRLWDDWYVNCYADGARPRLDKCFSNPNELIENAFFYSLDETIALLDALPQEEFRLIPCNCRTVTLNCSETGREFFCLQIGNGINTEWDRGHGKPLSKEEAKSLIREANRKGLMHTTETNSAICNCCACCCFPIRASERIGTKGLCRSGFMM